MVISCGSEAFHLGSDLSFIPQEVSSTACKDEWTADVSLTSLKGGKSGGDSLYSFLGSFEAYKLAVYIITWPTNQRVFIVLPSISASPRLTVVVVRLLRSSIKRAEVFGSSPRDRRWRQAEKTGGDGEFTRLRNIVLEVCRDAQSELGVAASRSSSGSIRS